MTLDTRRMTCIADMQTFLDGSDTVHFEAPDAAARRHWLADLLDRFHYRSLLRPDKGVLRQFTCKLADYSRTQLTRLIGQWQATGALVDQRGPPVKAFAQRYTDVDVSALVKLDRLHQRLSGPTTRKLFRVFDDVHHERLAGIFIATCTTCTPAPGIAVSAATCSTRKSPRCPSTSGADLIRAVNSAIYA